MGGYVGRVTPAIFCPINWLLLGLSKNKINTAGGLPGSKLLSFASPKESSQRKGDPGLPPLRGTLRCSTGQAAAEFSPRRNPLTSLRYSAAHREL